MSSPEADIEAQCRLAEELLAELVAEENAFAASVKEGDRVRWSEWVWERGITGNPADPETSDRVVFTGTVRRVVRTGDLNRDWLEVDPSTVTPTAAEVRQRPRHELPVKAFRPAQSRAPSFLR